MSRDASIANVLEFPRFTIECTRDPGAPGKLSHPD
jgi:hypothetical protein